jgi:hypothetical protein
MLLSPGLCLDKCIGRAQEFSADSMLDCPDCGQSIMPVLQIHCRDHHAQMFPSSVHCARSQAPRSGSIVSTFIFATNTR